MLTGLKPFTACLDAIQRHAVILQERVEQAYGVGATTDASD
jgi:hypothetical protein